MSIEQIVTSFFTVFFILQMTVVAIYTFVSINREKNGSLIRMNIDLFLTKTKNGI